MQPIIIEPGSSVRRYWRDLWQYRELFQVLAWRDISVRYKQTVIGIAWPVIRPVLTMVVFTVIFGKIAKLPTVGDAPYALMVFAGMLPWTFFSTALSESSSSLVNNANLISKVFFPRLIVPTATIMGGLCRLPDQLFHSCRNDDLVPIYTRMADCPVAGVCRHRLPCEHWSRFMDYNSKRALPRLSLCDSIPCSIWPLCFASRIQ